MRKRAHIGLCYTLSLALLFQAAEAKSSFNGVERVTQSLTIQGSYGTPPIAVNDTFTHVSSSGNAITGNVLANDFDPDGDSLQIYFTNTPRVGNFTITPEGIFHLRVPDNFSGEINFEYYIIEQTSSNYKALANVHIIVLADRDYDKIPDNIDLDNDNDGIANWDEGDGLIDTDNDQIADCFDIDSDNDGITDNIEWQSEFSYIAPRNEDLNHNGWDDAYDNTAGGIYYAAEDTNNDGIPDMLDPDSDNDGTSDFIEAFDLDNDGLTEIQLSYSDIDKDGLDDAFDNVNDWIQAGNSTGSNSPLPDNNKNGVRDWRDFTNQIHETSNLVYPNPVCQSFIISHPNIKIDQLTTLQLFTSAGELILQKKVDRISAPINVSNLNNGIYLIAIHSGGFHKTQKIIINH